MHYKKAEDHPYNKSIVTVERRMKNLRIATDNSNSQDMKDIWEDKLKQLIAKYIRT